MGTPKALLRDAAGVVFVNTAVSVLHEGGCASVIVVVGAESDAVTALLDEPHDEQGLEDLSVVVAHNWHEGMGASLRAGLAAALETDAASVLVSLVDLPDVGASVARRMLQVLGSDVGVLGRASYDGLAGHPVLIGRDHWAGVIAVARGDRGARDYLSGHPATLVECGDLATGRDVDTRDQLP